MQQNCVVVYWWNVMVILQVRSSNSSVNNLGFFNSCLFKWAQSLFCFRHEVTLGRPEKMYVFILLSIISIVHDTFQLLFYYSYRVLVYVWMNFMQCHVWVCVPNNTLLHYYQRLSSFIFNSNLKSIQFILNHYIYVM